MVWLKRFPEIQVLLGDGFNFFDQTEPNEYSTAHNILREKTFRTHLIGDVVSERIEDNHK